MAVEFRKAQQADLQAIVTILNEIILEGGFNADLKTYTLKEKQKWFDTVSSEPYTLQCVLHNNTIIGFCYLSPWRGGREALSKVAEVSYYLQKAHRGKGYGKLMLKHIVETAKQNGFENLLAILLDSNLRSLQLLEQAGFKKVGHLPNVANLLKEKAGQFIYLKLLV